MFYPAFRRIHQAVAAKLFHILFYAKRLRFKTLLRYYAYIILVHQMQIWLT